MKTVPVKGLKSGMVLAAPIKTKQGQTIAETGTTLNNTLIAKLSFYRIDDVTVEEEEGAGSPALQKDSSLAPTKEFTLENQKYTAKTSRNERAREFQVIYTKNLSLLRSNIDYILSGEIDRFSKEDLLRETYQLFHSRTPLDLFDQLQSMRSVDDSIYAHSLNTAMIARAIGKWSKFPREELNVLVLAGLLHDIGKTQVPAEILNKTEKLTDEEFAMIKRHAQDGYAMLKSIPRLDDRIYKAALQHHERYDGSGYPSRLEGEDIEDFAGIIAIADVYDAMTATRSYRAPLSPFQVIGAFEKDGLQKYNPRFVLTFLEHIASAYQNSRVLLDNGLSGRIVYINRSKLSSPIVQLDDGQMCDLSREPGVHVQSIR